MQQHHRRPLVTGSQIVQLDTINANDIALNTRSHSHPFLHYIVTCEIPLARADAFTLRDDANHSYSVLLEAGRAPVAQRYLLRGTFSRRWAPEDRVAAHRAADPPASRGRVGTGGGEALDIRCTFREPKPQVRVKRNLALPQAGSRCRGGRPALRLGHGIRRRTHRGEDRARLPERALRRARRAGRPPRPLVRARPAGGLLVRGVRGAADARGEGRRWGGPSASMSRYRPLGFKPATSAVWRQCDGLLEASGACKMPANRDI
jgi:hypothetical protein